jgi:hypothetical protein
MSKRGASQSGGRPCSPAQLVTAPGWRPFDALVRAKGSSTSRERPRFAVRARSARPIQSCAGRGFLGARDEESRRADERFRGLSVWLSIDLRRASTFPFLAIILRGTCAKQPERRRAPRRMHNARYQSAQDQCDPSSFRLRHQQLSLFMSNWMGYLSKDADPEQTRSNVAAASIVRSRVLR